MNKIHNGINNESLSVTNISSNKIIVWINNRLQEQTTTMHVYTNKQQILAKKCPAKM